ncbi:E3 ubiquitin/ISG15 ligase TRIM25-like [Dendrobates tinctorius]|uniref:E3 ubiquitin/ISG15 ligase TRIM25-like n=1 Tax=Dendrobates tinctorius TaxID=92724 RepID=UPI003CC9584F
MADLAAELTCPICLDIFKDPVTLRCGHNFCWKCIDHALDSKRSRVYMCPQCRKRFKERPALTKNTNLSNIAEQFHSAQPDNDDPEIFCNYCDLPSPAIKTCMQCETSMCERHLRSHNRSVRHTLIDPTTSLAKRRCPIHNKILGYYCTVDGTCICLSCAMAKEHWEHQVDPLMEASEKKKEELRKILGAMNVKTEETERKVQTLQEEIRKVQEKANVVTRRVQDRFRLIVRELQVLEETLIRDIFQMKEQQLNAYNELISDLQKQNVELLKSKCHIEELCNMTDPYIVLQEKQSGVGSSCDSIEEERRPKLLHNAGGLDLHPISKTLQIGLGDIMEGLNFWFYTQKPANIYLDINSASHHLQMSDDLKTVTYVESHHNLPDKDERFGGDQVISTRSFSSGRHYWEVEIRDSENWGVGVCYSSMDRKGDQSRLGCNNKSWCLQRSHNGLVAEHNGHSCSLPYRTFCSRVRVYLDYNNGRLSFYEVSDAVKHVYTISTTFTEPLHAAFMVQNNWLRIKNWEERLKSA